MPIFAIKPKAALSVGAAATTWLIAFKAHASCPARLLEASISGDGTSSSQPKSRIDIARLSTLGTWTALAKNVRFDTAIAVTPASDLPLMLGTGYYTGTSADQVVEVLDGDEDNIPFSEYVHPQGGYTWRCTDLNLIIPAGGIIAMRAVAPASGAFNALPRLVIKEGA